MNQSTSIAALMITSLLAYTPFLVANEKEPALIKAVDTLNAISSDVTLDNTVHLLSKAFAGYDVLITKENSKILVKMPSDILFHFDSSQVNEDAKGLLIKLANAINDKPKYYIEIAGHTDSIGHEKYNLALSLRRSASIENILSRNGVPSYRLSADGYGELLPIASNKLEAGRQLNRRVELSVYINHLPEQLMFTN